VVLARHASVCLKFNNYELSLGIVILNSLQDPMNNKSYIVTILLPKRIKSFLLIAKETKLL
jgi:hypothetical protein